MSSRAETLPRSLLVAILLMTLVVLLLGGAVVAVKLRPDRTAPSTAERAITGWEEAVAQDPESDVARTGLGLALLQAGRTPEAREAFEGALRLNPDNWMANFQMGLLLRESDPEGAVERLDAAAENAAPGDKAVPLIAMGDFLLEQQDPEGARDAYRRSIADVPYLFDSHFGLAQALEQLGEVKAALNEYKQAGRYAPGHPEVEAAIERLGGSD